MTVSKSTDRTSSALSCKAKIDKSGLHIFTEKKSYNRVRILVLDFEKLHGTDHGLHGHEDVLKDQLDEPSLIFVCVTGSVNNAHLFNERRFAGFSRTCKDHKVIKALKRLLVDWLSFPGIYNF